jgi:hypothetical protein
MPIRLFLCLLVTSKGDYYANLHANSVIIFMIFGWIAAKMAFFC